MEPTDFTFRTTSDMTNDFYGTARGDGPGLVLVHKEGGGQLTQKESGKADAERLAKGDDFHIAPVGLVQLFIEANNSSDDDFFADLVGRGTTDPLLHYSNGDDEDRDRESSEVEDEDGNDEYWDEESSGRDEGLGGWPHEDEWSEEDEGSEEEDTYRAHQFTTHLTLDHKVTALGRSVSHADTLLTRQFRTSIFSLSVTGRFVRLLRWDREGVTVSEAIDYKDDPLPLATFLRAFASAPDSGRGWDTSARFSHDPKDEELFRTKITEYVMHQLRMEGTNPDLASKVKEHYQERVITKLFVPSTEPGEPLQVLVSRPCFVSSSPTGLSMRRYWGVVVGGTIQESEVVCVKDIWRSNVERVEREGDILLYLHEKGVRNIPLLVAHGDVEVDGKPMRVVQSLPH